MRYLFYFKQVLNQYVPIVSSIQITYLFNVLCTTCEVIMYGIRRIWITILEFLIIFSKHNRSFWPGMNDENIFSPFKKICYENDPNNH